MARMGAPLQLSLFRRFLPHRVSNFVRRGGFEFRLLLISLRPDNKLMLTRILLPNRRLFEISQIGNFEHPTRMLVPNAIREGRVLDFEFHPETSGSNFIRRTTNFRPATSGSSSSLTVAPASSRPLVPRLLLVGADPRVCPSRVHGPARHALFASRRNRDACRALRLRRVSRQAS